MYYAWIYSAWMFTSAQLISIKTEAAGFGAWRDPSSIVLHRTKGNNPWYAQHPSDARITRLSASSSWDKSILYHSLCRILRKKGKPVCFHCSRKYMEKLPSQDLKITFESKPNHLYHDCGGENTDIHKLSH